MLKENEREYGITRERCDEEIRALSKMIEDRRRKENSRMRALKEKQRLLGVIWKKGTLLEESRSSVLCTDISSLLENYKS